MCVCGVIWNGGGGGGVQIWQVIVGYYRTESKGFWGGVAQNQMAVQKDEQAGREGWRCWWSWEEWG